MNRPEFQRMRAVTFGELEELNDRKGKDYAGDEDVLSNFKDAASQLGVEPEQVWAVYAHKHWSAIMAYCREGKVESEGIEGRIHDLMVYCLLLLGLVDDRQPMQMRDALAEAEAGNPEPECEQVEAEVEQEIQG